MEAYTGVDRWPKKPLTNLEDLICGLEDNLRWAREALHHENWDLALQLTRFEGYLEEAINISKAERERMGENG